MIEDFENCERRVAAMQKRRKPVRKILCSVLIGFAIIVIAILAIPAGLFLGGDCLRLEHNGQNRSNH